LPEEDGRDGPTVRVAGLIESDDDDTFTRYFPSARFCWMFAVSSGLIGPTVCVGVACY